MTLEKRDLLQVNATIIAGLLILLTIQSTSTSFWDLYEDHLSINEKIQELEKLANDNSTGSDLEMKISERIIELKIKDTENLAETNFVEKPVNPMILFLITMVPFIGSCIWEIHESRKTPDIRMSSIQGRSMAYVGFVLLFASTLGLILIRWLNI